MFVAFDHWAAGRLQFVLHHLLSFTCLIDQTITLTADILLGCAKGLPKTLKATTGEAEKVRLEM